MRAAGLALLTGAAAGLVAATQPVADTDLFWHLATARETLAHGLVRADVFSWTVRGAPVSVDQWLGQLLLYGAYLAADARGIAVLRVLLVTALLALVVWNASLHARRPLAIVLAAMPALVLTRAVWVDRPELAGLVCFAALLPLLHLARGGNDRALVALVVLVAIWANLHGSFALGAVLAVLVSLEGAARDPRRRGAYVAAAAAVALATLATPAGLATWTAPGTHLFAPPRDIQEWGTIDLGTPLGAAYAATLGLVLACVLLGPRPALRELVVLVPVALLSLTAARQAPLLAIAAAPLFAASAERALGRIPRAGMAPGDAAPASTPFALAAALLIALAVAIAPARFDERAYPTGALGALPAGDGVLARYEWGGWLIWRAPRTPVFVDGRLVPYQASGALDEYRRIVGASPGWESIVARRGVRALLVTPADPIALRAPELGWHELAASDVFVLLEAP